MQEIDLKLYAFINEKDTLKPQYLESLKLAFEKKQAELNDCEANLKKIQLKRKEKELELAAKEENLRKAQGHLYQLRTNKEYQAKLNEIGSLKADISLEEESLLKVMEEAEAAKKDFDLTKAALAKEEESFRKQETAIKEEIKTLEAGIKNLEEKRNRFVEEIAPEVLVKYQKLLKSRQGEAIAQVRGADCSACHIQVTHQKINEIKMYKNLVFCENCVRILYLPEDLKL